MFSPLSTIAKRLFQDGASNTLGSWQEKPQFLLKFWSVQRKYSKGSASTQATSSPPPRTIPAPTEHLLHLPAPTEQSRCQPICAHRCVTANVGTVGKNGLSNTSTGKNLESCGGKTVYSSDSKLHVRLMFNLMCSLESHKCTILASCQ